MKTSLSLQVLGTAGEGSDLRHWDTIFEYEVRGLPPGERAFIANFGGRNEAHLKVLRVHGEVQEQWTGDYPTENEALAVLQKEYEG
jgi:hypothetical protein